MHTYMHTYIHVPKETRPNQKFLAMAGGGHAVEILLLLFAIKRDCPESLEILRGNHEDTNCTIHYGAWVVKNI